MSPLAKGRGHKTISANVSEMMDSYKRTGKIGKVRPSSAEHALRVASAAAYNMAGKGRKKK